MTCKSNRHQSRTLGHSHAPSVGSKQDAVALASKTQVQAARGFLLRHQFIVSVIAVSLAFAACNSEPPSWSVSSDDNVVGRKSIELDRGNYTLTNRGCLIAELVERSTDDVVISVEGSDIAWGMGSRVDTGEYIVRAIGEDCEAILRLNE